MKHLTIILALLLMSCASQRSSSTVNREGMKAQKRQQETLGKTYGRNYNAPNKFKRRHF